MWNKTRLKDRAVINYHWEQSQKTQNTVSTSPQGESTLILSFTNSFPCFLFCAIVCFQSHIYKLNSWRLVICSFVCRGCSKTHVHVEETQPSSTSVNTANSGANAAYWNRVALKKEGKVQRVLMICSHLGYSFSRGNGHPAEVKHDVWYVYISEDANDRAPQANLFYKFLVWQF